MKKLDEKQEEVRIFPKYSIARFMKEKKAFKDGLCFFGIIKKDKQLHIHVRFKAIDEQGEEISEPDILDIDVYIPKEETEKIRKLLNVT